MGSERRLSYENLADLLVNLADDKEYVVFFECGDVLGLRAFEMVDESIYGRHDLCVADIVTPIKCNMSLYPVNTGLQFSLSEIIRVVDASTQETIFLR